MDTKKLFWSIFSAKDEAALHNIVLRNELLSNNHNWFPYGGRDKNDRSNFGTFENQQSNPVPALIEKVTNSIDSLLLKQCKLMKIDPKSKEAPSNMAIAVEKFFDIKNGDFSEISQSGRRSIAEDIQVIAEGDKQMPNLLIYDYGEGQHPDDFHKTFLSLSRCNKTDIPFVQGKYNMGSTGAVIFCGDHRYQLIASKLCNELNTKASNDFGFTLVRKHPLTEEEEGRLKSSWYEYFTIDGKIPRFSIKEIDLGLYKRKFTTGAIVKLYSYGLPKGSRSYVTWDLWRDFNHYLYHPALPFLVYEKRWSNQKTPSKPVLGNKIRLTLDDRDKKEDESLTITISDSKIGEVPIETHVFKQHVDQKEFINNKAVVFTQNGQVHGFLTRSFISKVLGFPLLRDHMLIQVNCTKIKTSVRQDLFKGSRDRLNEGIKTELLIDKITVALRDNEKLKLLNQNRKNRILRESTEDKNLLATVLTNLSIDKEIMKLLKNNEEFNLFKKLNKFKKEDKADKQKENKKAKYISKRFPSIFKINIDENGFGKKLKSVPLGGKGIIRFATDVEDEYLFRPKEKGELELAVLGIKSNGGGGDDGSNPSKVEDIFDITKAGPTDNSIKITFEPKANVNVGDEIELKARLSSPSGDLESIFWVRIIDPQQTGQKVKENKEKDNIAPPIPIRVFEYAEKKEDKTWEDYGWGGNDITKIITSQVGKGETAIEAIAVNMGCFALKRFLSKKQFKTEEEIRTIKNKFFITVYLHSLFLYSILDRINKDENCDTEIDPDDIVPIIFKPYSNFLLSSSMIESLI